MEDETEVDLGYGLRPDDYPSGNSLSIRDFPPLRILGTWQHRISPGVVPVIVGDQFDQDEADEEFDTPLVCQECGGYRVVDFFSKKKPCEVCG